MTFLTTESRFGLLPFFESITWRELQRFAQTQWRTYYQDDEESFLMEMYIVCLNNIDSIEKMAIKSTQNIPERFKHLMPEDITDLDSDPQYAFIAKSFQRMFKTFLRNRAIKWWEKSCSGKWQELRNSKNGFKPNVVNNLIREAVTVGFPVPQEIKDEYNLRHLKRQQVIAKVTEKHDISIPNLAWRRKMWVYRFLSFLDKPLYINELSERHYEKHDHWDV